MAADGTWSILPVTATKIIEADEFREYLSIQVLTDVLILYGFGPGAEAAGGYMRTYNQFEAIHLDTALARQEVWAYCTGGVGSGVYQTGHAELELRRIRLVQQKT